MNSEAPITPHIPIEVSYVTETLEKAGFEAYLVGGCVRDLLLKITPTDWDITTNATPEEIVSTFPHTFYENKFGTVGIINEETKNDSLRNIEVTTYRLETTYSDGRHPDQVLYSKELEDDLKRRDFTINSLAYNVDKGQIVDLYKGQEDLRDGTVRAVGNARERFSEDGLRILRAVRIANQLGFTINKETEEAIMISREILSKIAKERIRDEFIKILNSDTPKRGLELCQKLGILKFITPHFERGMGINQNQAHKFDVWEHNLRSLQHAADQKWPFHIRLSALFHDISKPETRRWSEGKKDWTFYGHDVVGGRVTRETLKELRFSKETIDLVSKMVRWHMFFSDTEQITLSAVRRLIANIGKENVWDLMDLRVCDRIGTGRPKANPYRLRKYKSMVEEAMRDPVSVGMLKIDGKRLMEVTHETPGPKIGNILYALLQEVLEDPTKNTSMYLEERGSQIAELSALDLKSLGEQGREKKEEEDERLIEDIRKRHWVE
jgi:tRNA nucleotidyltransferase (CCA-adding enzyme)